MIGKLARAAAPLWTAALLASCATAVNHEGCGSCPEMRALPAGEFVMGSPAEEQGRFDDESPRRVVVFERPFELAAAPVTRAQYAAFVRDTARPDPGACMAMSNEGEWRQTPGLSWRDPGFAQADDHPVVCVSWEDSLAYAHWLGARTGQAYRLPSEAEFEYAARAGATTPYPWGAAVDEICARANGFDLAARRQHPDWPSLACDDGYAFTAPVDAFPANAFGLTGMTGNVFQWTADCYAESYAGAPVDGSAHDPPDCAIRVIRGGSWLNGARPALGVARPRSGGRPLQQHRLPARAIAALSDQPSASIARAIFTSRSESPPASCVMSRISTRL